jgi:hypothetical protein
LPTDRDEGGVRRKQKKLEIKLQKDKNGYPILPSLKEIDSHDLLYRKRLIGKVISNTYCL